MVGCSVVGCKTRSSLLDDVSFYKFPSDGAIKKKWMIATGLPESKLSQHQRICSKHFTSDCFRQLKRGKKALKNASIPTLNVYGPGAICVDLSTENTKHNVNMSVRDIKRNLIGNNRGTKRKLVDTEVVDVNSDVEGIDVESDTECVMTEIVTGAEETIVTTEKPTMNVNTLVSDNSLPPEIRKLIFKLQRTAQVAQSQKKTIARLQSRVFSLRKKNEELTATIEIMKNEALKDHKGPSILLVGM